MYAVERFDYAGLVTKMEAAGIEQMDVVLSAAFIILPQPEFELERTYFWRALYNASRRSDIVWLWLCIQYPALDTGRGMHAYPQFVPDWELPIIHADGKRIDHAAEAKRQLTQYPGDPTEANFVEQAGVLAMIIATLPRSDEDVVQSVQQFVDTWRHSGTGKMQAQIRLQHLGLHALATPAGIQWLLEHYLNK